MNLRFNLSAMRALVRVAAIAVRPDILILLLSAAFVLSDVMA